MTIADILTIVAGIILAFCMIVVCYGAKLYLETRHKVKPELRQITHMSLREFWRKTKGKSPIFIEEDEME